MVGTVGTIPTHVQSAEPTPLLATRTRPDTRSSSGRSFDFVYIFPLMWLEIVMATGSMGMRILKNSVPMVGLQTPMGGKYTNLKVRENLECYAKDPGWYPLASL